MTNATVLPGLPKPPAAHSPTTAVIPDKPQIGRSGSHELAESLTLPAFRLCEELMVEAGNVLTDQHREALMLTVGSFTQLATGYRKGRFAYPLPCGAGKTTAVVAWLTALHRNRINKSALVCAAKVSELVDVKRRLCALGVPDGKIGLLHSYKEDVAGLPATDQNENRPILLATHQRVKGGNLEPARQYNGRPRDLIIWDESLIVSETLAFEKIAIEQARAVLAVRAKYEPDTIRAALAWADKTLEALDEGASRVVPIPAVDPDAMQALPHQPEFRVLRELVELADMPVRVLPNSFGGIVSAYITVPEELQSVAVLDASYPIRMLQQCDRSIQQDARFTRIGPVKRYDNVRLHHWKRAAGKSAMVNDFSQARAKRSVSKAVGDLVRTIPRDEPILFLTFKPTQGPKGRGRSRQEIDFAQIIREDLAARKIDPDATTSEGHPRFNFLTWGRETATSALKHCQHVITVGVMQRSDRDLAGSMLGQKRDMAGPVDGTDIRRLRMTEATHHVYQAINRAACRDTDAGQAKRTDIWLMFDNPDMVTELAKVMPGMAVDTWEGAGPVKASKTDALQAQIARYLEGLTENRVTVRKLKSDLELGGVPNRVFQVARDRACAGTGWGTEGRSLVRKS